MAQTLDPACTPRSSVFDPQVRDTVYSIDDLKSIDPDQAWFWTPEWQAKEREADEDIAAGRGTLYLSDEEVFASLDE